MMAAISLLERSSSIVRESCAPCDEGMYPALGFDVRLGTTFAYLP